MNPKTIRNNVLTSIFIFKICYSNLFIPPTNPYDSAFTDCSAEISKWTLGNLGWKWYERFQPTDVFDQSLSQPLMDALITQSVNFRPRPTSSHSNSQLTINVNSINLVDMLVLINILGTNMNTYDFKRVHYYNFSHFNHSYDIG